MTSEKGGYEKSLKLEDVRGIGSWHRHGKWEQRSRRVLVPFSHSEQYGAWVWKNIRQGRQPRSV